MFEKAIPIPAGPAAVGGALRPLDWGELVARLGAARDLRALFARSDFAPASFAPELGAGAMSFVGAKPYVNPDGLAGGKTGSAKGVATVPAAEQGDREQR
jgi:hypothetical protein